VGLVLRMPASSLVMSSRASNSSFMEPTAASMRPTSRSALQGWLRPALSDEKTQGMQRLAQSWLAEARKCDLYLLAISSLLGFVLDHLVVMRRPLLGIAQREIAEAAYSDRAKENTDGVEVVHGDDELPRGWGITPPSRNRIPQ